MTSPPWPVSSQNGHSKLYLAMDWFQNSEWFDQISDNEPQGATIRLSHEQETRRWWRQRTDLR